MSNLGKNIKKIRGIKKLSQSGFAELFNLTRASVSAYEEDRSEPRSTKALEIANYFGITVEQLLTSDLTVNMLANFDVFKSAKFEENSNKSLQTSVINNIPFVGGNNIKQYANKCKTEDYINSLDKLILPISYNDQYRAFEHQSNNMLRNGIGLYYGDVLITQKIEKFNALNSTEDSVFVVVTSEKITTCRVKIKPEGVVLLFDKTTEMSIFLSEEELIEIWRVEAVFSYNLPTISSLELRVEAVERKLER